MMNIQKSSVRDYYRYIFYACIAFAFVFIFSFNTSPFYLGYGGDSSAFKQMGLLIVKGGIPYIDFYDNKGLTLYLFNALGILISPQWGTCILQCIMMFSTLIIWDKLLKVLGTKRPVVFILLALSILFFFYQGGNLTEDFCLLFISIPLLFYFNAYQTKKEININQYFIVGFCFGIITFVRVNNVLPFIFFYLFVVIDNIRNRKLLIIAKKLSAALAGFLLIAICNILIMIAIGGVASLDDMFYWMFGVNFERLVFSTDTGRTLDKTLRLIVPMLSLLIVSCLLYFKNKTLLVPILLSQIFTLVSCILRPYAHYCAVLVPIYLIILGTGNNKTKCTYLIYFILLCSLNFRIIYNDVMRFRREVLFNRIWFEEAYINFHNTTTQMPQIEKNKIFNFEDWAGLSLLNKEGIIQYNKNTLTHLNEELYNMTEQNSIDALPQWILISENASIDSANSLFINKHYTKRIPIGTASWKELYLLGLDSATFKHITNTQTNPPCLH